MEKLKEKIMEIFRTTTTQEQFEEVDWDAMFLRIIKRTVKGRPALPVHRIHFLKRTWLRYAAVVIIVLGTGVYFWFNSKTTPINRPSIQLNQLSDIAPGGNKAILTLLDGRKIVLDNAANGNLAQQGNTKIIKLNNGQLVYKAAEMEQNKPGPVSANIISTPRGGQYQIVLPDGSKVWLNAASSLRFPTAFTEATRKVELTGEAYFEIAANKQQPFMVTTNGTQVQVLGTSFNINAYEDEATIKTTLLEGSVKVFSENFSKLLKPGQEATIRKDNNTINITNNADIQLAVAWKNGLFQFANADLETVLRQLGRWYDVDISYIGMIHPRKFEGKIQRDLTLSQVLKVLEGMQVKFKMEGRKLIVMP